MHPSPVEDHEQAGELFTLQELTVDIFDDLANSEVIAIKPKRPGQEMSRSFRAQKRLECTLQMLNEKGCVL
ncbi:hypothetical protein PTKU46_84840 [Paraburkholderia terrae]